MKLGSLTTVFVEKSLHAAAKRMHDLGLECIEIGTGGFFPKNHCDPARLLKDSEALEKFKDTIAEHNLTISAFATHGEPLHPDPEIADAYVKDLHDTYKLAEKVGVTRITLLAGLPEAGEGGTHPSWILYPFPSYMMDTLQWQWENRLIPYWKQHGKVANDHGVQLCMEMHPNDMVHKPETLLRLRDAVGPVIGCNLDPSHLFHQGMDITAVIRKLGSVIYHTHAKDSRSDPNVVAVNGILDAKDFQDLENRSWLFRTVGYGHDELFWRNYVSTLRLVGYDEVLSIEHEDPLIDPEEGFEAAVQLLKRAILIKPRRKLWYE